MKIKSSILQRLLVLLFPGCLLYSQEPSRRVTGHKGAVTAFALTRGGDKLISGGDDRSVYVWDTKTWQALLQLKDSHIIDTLALSPKSDLLATGLFNGTITIWDLKTKTTVATLRASNLGVQSVKFHPTQELLYSTAWDERKGHVQAWDTKKFTLLHSSEEHCPRQLFILDKAQIMVIGAAKNDTGKIQIFDDTLMKPTEVFKGHTSDVVSVARSKDGKLLATGSSDKTVRVWQVADGKLLHKLTTNSELPLGLVFSPDAKHLLCGAQSDDILIFDINREKLVHKLVGHKGLIYQLVFSADGKQLYSGSQLQDILIWDWATVLEKIQ